MKRLYVHIGTHKTGSTAIQRALRKGGSGFRVGGSAFVEVPRSFAWMMRAKDVNQTSVVGAREDLRSSLGALRRRHARSFVLSWEGFSGDPYCGYDNAASVAEALRRATEGFDVTILVFVRRQDQLIESLYTQRIHEGESLRFSEFSTSLGRSAFDWDRHLAGFEEAFGQQNIIVRPYDRCFLPNEDSLLEEFGNLVGCPWLSAVARGGAPNAGYTRDALEIARLVNPHLDDSQKHLLRRVLQQSVAKMPFEQYSFFSDQERRTFLERYEESNNRVARRYLTGIRERLFTAPGEHDRNHDYPGLTVQSVLQVLKGLCFFLCHHL